jgi:hypothetical protein
VHPQPARERVAIGYAVPGAGAVELRIFDALGRLVRGDRQEHPTPGRYAFMVERGGLPPGLYVYALRHAEFAARGKFIVNN